MSLLARLLKDFDVLTFRFYIYFLKRGFIIIITSTNYHLDNTPSFAIILPIGSEGFDHGLAPQSPVFESQPLPDRVVVR